MQPLIVRPLDDHRFEIIAGERRWHAAKLAGLDEIPVVIRSADASEALQLALIENIQREDISPLECANAYQALIMEHGLTQDDVAQHVGKSRPAVANALRLLRLPLEIRESLARGEISEGHARALLQFDTEAEQLLIHRRILEKGLNVREVERLAKGSTATPAIREKPYRMREPNELESALSEFFGTPVSINRQGKGGKIEVEFYNEDDLSRILEKLDIRL